MRSREDSFLSMMMGGYRGRMPMLANQSSQFGSLSNQGLSGGGIRHGLGGSGRLMGHGLHGNHAHGMMLNGAGPVRPSGWPTRWSIGSHARPDGQRPAGFGVSLHSRGKYSHGSGPAPVDCPSHNGDVRSLDHGRITDAVRSTGSGVDSGYIDGERNSRCRRSTGSVRFRCTGRNAVVRATGFVRGLPVPWPGSGLAASVREG